MLKHPEVTASRIRQWARRFLPAIYPERKPLTVLVAGPVDRISYDEAQKLEYRPAEPGMKLGPQWATYWFKVSADLPGAIAVVDKSAVNATIIFRLDDPETAIACLQQAGIKILQGEDVYSM